MIGSDSVSVPLPSVQYPRCMQCLDCGSRGPFRISVRYLGKVWCQRAIQVWISICVYVYRSEDKREPQSGSKENSRSEGKECYVIIYRISM